MHKQHINPTRRVWHYPFELLSPHVIPHYTRLHNPTMHTTRTICFPPHHAHPAYFWLFAITSH